MRGKKFVGLKKLCRVDLQGGMEMMSNICFVCKISGPIFVSSFFVVYLWSEMAIRSCQEVRNGLNKLIL
jgi:hypothetical protein